MRLSVLLALLALSGCAWLDRGERQTLAAHNVSAPVVEKMMRGNPLPLAAVVELSQRQVPPDLIIRYLHSTGAVYNLDKPLIARLEKEKVSREVIHYLLATPFLFGPGALNNPWFSDWFVPDFGPTVIVVREGHRPHPHRR